jgi:two-component system phosphate regulon sensor histidine kinase PhoR
MTSLRKILRNFKKKQRFNRRLKQVYYKKLLKASLLLTIVPIMVISILVVYARLSFIEGIVGAIFVFFGSTFFAKPYLDDLSSLTKYVEHLVIGQKSEAPPLSFLGNINELSQSVKDLNTSWGNRTIELEAALAESSILFDTIPDILLMLDKDLNIVRANNAATRIFSRSLVNQPLKSLHPEAGFLNTVKSVLKSDKQTASMEASFRVHNIMQDYLVMIEKFPVQSIAGVALVIVMHDVTEEKSRKQMMKDFVANASHEIRTPLTSVMGFIENLQAMEEESGSSAGNKKIRRQFLAIMAEQTERMSNLTNDLLSLSKAEINERTFPTDFVNLEEILKGVQRRLTHLSKEKGMKITLKNAKNLPEIIGDYNELTQVFTNIISNAIKYGYEKTIIEVNVKITTEFHKSGHMPKSCKSLLLISVKDEGEGIADEHLPRITERFYRVDKVRSRKVGGTGLGLAITKHILFRHGGDMVIESELGKGSVFTVRLPVLK